MAARAERRPRRGPAPIASFDRDVSDESSPENKQAGRLPEIREGPSCSSASVAAPAGDSLAPPEQRARSHSSPAVHAASPAPPAGAALQAPAAPRIDISRASSSSHHDSRDSSPELALFAGDGADDARAHLDLGFREDGALELRSSTEELAFLEGAAGGEARAPQPARRPSRRDSQGSEAALLAVSGRTSRVSSVGSQCSAFSHVSRVSRLSVASGASRSPSPHRMLLETSFCGPKPIETDPELCAAAVERRLLEIAQLGAPVDARDRREVRTEATVESAPAPPRLASPAAPPPTPAPPTAAPARLDDDKLLKETRNRARAEERRARSRDRREPPPTEPSERGDRTRDIIRIKLKPDDEYDDDGEDEGERTPVGGEPARKPATLELGAAGAPAAAAPARRPRDSRTPSPAGAPASRKSSFCSLFKSRETIASPDSPCDALRRKKSLNEGRSRSKSRDRSATPTSAGKIKGSVLSLFKTPRRSGASPAAGSRDASPAPPMPRAPPDDPRAERLKYYEEAENGVIHIPLRTPPDEPAERARPASAPQARAPPERRASSGAPPVRRTVLPDGSIIIPLRSPTERTASGPGAAPLDRTSPQDDATFAPRPSPEASRAAAEVRPSRADAAESTSGPGTPSPEPDGPAAPAPDGRRPRRKERLVFTTHVGSKEQVFSTQFSITKTPSVTSEISESIPSFPECEEVRPTDEAAEAADEAAHGADEAADGTRSGGSSPAARSSGSEASAEGGSEAERRGLVVQESFEELPYVPTTLPLERSLALPMVPVRERGGVRTAALQRPRARRAALEPPAAPPAAPPTAPPTAPPAAERLHIHLPRERSRSLGVAEPRDWVDFSEVPERRKQAKRIQTLPAAREQLVLSYVPPERCRCECHAAAEPAPFAADLDLRHHRDDPSRPH